MRAPLSIAVVQPPCTALEIAVNAAKHAAMVRAAGARVVVFPELSLSGYELEAPAIEVEDQRLMPLVAACAETGSVALVGAPLRGQAERVHIAMLAVDGTRVSVAYRKLWVDESESRFAPGDRPVMLEVDGWRLGLAICKDTGRPQHWADTAALGIDAYVGGIVMFPDEIDTIEERGRRIARDCNVWVALASFAGPTGSGYDQTAGHSGIWRPGGDAIARAEPEVGAIVSATIS